MEELKPCPFCGCKADVIIGQNWVQVGCPNCDITTKTTSVFGSIYEIIEAWNTRYESTCTNLYHEGSPFGEGGFRCSVCDAEMEGDSPTYYCYRCGAKVVD